MAEQKQNIVDDMKDIGKIVNAVKTSASVLSKLSDAVVAINDKVDAKEFRTAAKNVKVLIAGVNDFTTQLGELVQQMTSAFKKDELDNLQQLFVDANIYKVDENGHLVFDKDGSKILAESHSTLPVVICKITDSLGKMISSMQNIGNIKIDPVNLLKMKVGFFVLSKNLSEVVDLMYNTFGDLANDQRMKDMMNFLVSDPEKIIKTTDTSSNTHSSNTSKVNTSDISNTMKQREEVMKGKMGFLDAISAFLGILNTLNTLNPPNYIAFKINMFKTKLMMKNVLSDMIKMQQSFGGDLNKLNALVKPLQSLNDVFYAFGSISDTLEKVGSQYRKIRRADKVLKKVNKIIDILYDIFNSEKFKKLDGDADKIVKSMKNLNTIIDEVEAFSEAITKTELYIIAAGLLAIPAMLSLILVAIFLVELWGVMNLVNLMFGNKNYKELAETFENIEKTVKQIAFTVIILTTAIVMLALAGMLAMESWKEILIGIGFVLLLVGVMAIIALAGNLIKDGAKEMLLLATTIIILTATVVLMIFVADLIKNNEENLMLIVAVVGMLVLMMVFLGVMSKFIQKGNTAVIVLALSLILVTAAIAFMLVVAKILDFEAMLQMVAVIGALAACVAGVGLAAIPITIGAGVLILMSVSLIVASVALFMFLGVVERINKMNLKADENGKAAVQAPIELFKAVIEKTNEIGLIEIAKATAKMISLMIIAASLGKMADVIQKVSAMTIPYEFDKEGKPTAYRRMTEADFTSASNNIATILTTILTAIGSDEMTAVLDNLKGKSVENITKVMESAGSVESLINAIEKVSAFDEATITNGTLKIKQVITAYVGVLSDLFVGQGEWTTKATKFLGRTINLPFYQVISEALIKTENIKKAVSGMKTLNTSIEKIIPILDGIQTIVDKSSSIDDGIKNIEKIANIQDAFTKIDGTKLTRSTNNFVRFVDKANSVDTKKIKSVTEMFEKMARFSESIKGDFNALADVLSDKLVDVLNKLHTAIGDLSKTDTAAPAVAQQAKQQAVETKETKQKIDPKALQNIEDILTEMSSMLKDVRENTENLGGGY